MTETAKVWGMFQSPKAEVIGSATVIESPATIVEQRIATGRQVVELRGRLAAAELGAECARLSGELTALLHREKSLRDSHVRAIRALWASQAGRLEAEASDIERAATAHQKRANELQEQLQEHEGCEFTPGPPREGIFGVRQVGIPKSRQMREEAKLKRAQAEQLRARQPLDEGEAVGESVDELITAMSSSDSTRIFPIVSSVIEVAESALEEGRARMSRRIINGIRGDGRRFTVKVLWKAGQIEYARPVLPDV